VRPVPAVVVVLAGLALLGVGVRPLVSMRMGANVVGDLPSSAEPARALDAAAAGFAPGIVAPTELVLSGSGIADARASLADLQHRVARIPGVAGVLGPAEQPLPVRAGAVYAPSGDAVRMLIVLRDRPYGSAAVADLARLQDRLPGLLAATGLHPSSVAWAGDTAVVQEVVGAARTDLFRVGLVALGVLLVILVAFLRALVAPVVLLLFSASVVGAALGATYWLFSALTPEGGPTFFVPLAVAVLLLAFGSDYNIFLVGRIRERSAEEPWRAAVVRGGAEASRAIGSAGLALAGSFAMLALVPLQAFREFAFAMVVGILLDTFVVRSYVVPAALALLGPAAGWPGRRLGRGAPATSPVAGR
jgi:RND superfamily putative drug exporter